MHDFGRILLPAIKIRMNRNVCWFHRWESWFSSISGVVCGVCGDTKNIRQTVFHLLAFGGHYTTFLISNHKRNGPPLSLHGSVCVCVRLCVSAPFCCFSFLLQFYTFPLETHENKKKKNGFNSIEWMQRRETWFCMRQVFCACVSSIPNEPAHKTQKWANVNKGLQMQIPRAAEPIHTIE